MKKRGRRWLATALCLCLLLGATACAEKDPDPSEYKQALAAIEKKDYDTAYNLLRASKDRRAAEELEKFVFVPVKCTYQCSDGTDVVYEHTYDALGNLLKRKATYASGSEYIDEYTYSGYKMLSHYYQSHSNVYTDQYTYDSAGNRVQEWHLDRNGNWIRKTTYAYDDQNRCLSWETIKKEAADDPEPKLSNTQYYTYDDEGRVLIDECTDYYEGVLAEQTKVYYTYEEDGSYCKIVYQQGSASGFDPISTIYCTADGKVLKGEYRAKGETAPYKTFEYRYNDRGDVEYYHEYFAPNESEEVTLYEYDDQGRLLKKETTNLEDEITYIECCTYDERGNRLTHERVDMDVNGWHKEVCTYDERNHLLTQQEDYDGGWANTTYTYDEQGNKIKEEQERENGSYTKTFGYDAWGNLVSYSQYLVETIGETATEETAQWELHYYPKGIPDEVQRAIAEAY